MVQRVYRQKNLQNSQDSSGTRHTYGTRAAVHKRRCPLHVARQSPGQMSKCKMAHSIVGPLYDIMNGVGTIVKFWNQYHFISENHITKYFN